MGFQLLNYFFYFPGERIYCIGGIGGKGGTFEQRLSSMECLDMTERSRWKSLPSMSTPRSSHTCEVMDGLIYVVGGGDGADWLSSAEVCKRVIVILVNNFVRSLT